MNAIRLACFCVAIGLSAAGCASGLKVLSIQDTGVPRAIRELAQDHSEYFGAPLTLMIIADGSACVKSNYETVWWKEWKAATVRTKAGFLLATSSVDSAGLVLAAHLDGVDAPVLVLPGCKDYVLELGLLSGTVPLKALVDPTGAIRRVWGYVPDEDACHRLMSEVDSLVQIEVQRIASMSGD